MWRGSEAVRDQNVSITLGTCLSCSEFNLCMESVVKCRCRSLTPKRLLGWHCAATALTQISCRAPLAISNKFSLPRGFHDSASFRFCLGYFACFASFSVWQNRNWHPARPHQPPVEQRNMTGKTYSIISRRTNIVEGESRKARISFLFLYWRTYTPTYIFAMPSTRTVEGHVASTYQQGHWWILVCFQSTRPTPTKPEQVLPPRCPPSGNQTVPYIKK